MADFEHVLLPGIGCEDFTQAVYEQIGLDAVFESVILRPIRGELFANGEWRIQISPTLDDQAVIRGRHVYFVTTGTGVGRYSVNDVIVYTLGVLDACQRADAKSITLIWLLYPYARSDKKMISREPIMASMLMRALEGVKSLRRIVTMDIHSGQIQGFPRRIGFANLFGTPCLRDGIRRCLTDEYPEEPIVLVSPDTGSVRRTRDYLNDLSEFTRAGLAPCSVIISKTRSVTQNNCVEQSILAESDKELVRGRTAIIIDDMIDTAGTIVAAAEILRSAEVNRIIVVATHGILSDPAIDRLNGCDLITRVIVTDTVNQTEHLPRCPKLLVVSAAPLIARYIDCLLRGISLATLYE